VERDLRLLSIGFAIRTFGAALYNPFLALFLYSILHVGYLEIGIIFVAVGSVQLPFGLIGGLWCDRVGRRRLIVLGLATEAILTGLFAYGFAIRSLALVIGVAAIGGSLLAATGPAYAAYIADFAEGSERTRGFTWYRIAFNAGFAAGTAIGGTLVAFVGFAEAVAIAATIIAGAAGFVLLLLRPSPYDVKLAQGQGPAAGPAPDRPSGPSLRQSLAKIRGDRVALLVAAGFALMYVTAGQWSVIFPLFVHNKLGISYSILGIGLALNGLVVVFGQSVTTESMIGRRHTTIAILGAVVTALAYVLLGASALWTFLPVEVFFLSVVILTVGENLGAIPTSTLPSNLAPEGEVGAYNGAFTMFLGAAGLAAIFLGGAVLSSVENPLLEWLILVAPVVPGAFLIRWAARRVPLHQDQA
jgi:MFS family permease